jgi:mRNA interferase RelE/StbE
LSPDFQIAETETYQKEIRRPELKKIYEKIRKYVYPQLKLNPFFGKNIKKLKGEWKDIFRYRIGNWRLFYTIDKSQVIVFILAIAQRQDAY